MDELLVGPAEVSHRGKNIVAKLDERLEAALARMKPAARAARDAFADLAPGEVTVEFGLCLDAEAGVVIAKTAASAHFVVSAKWTSDGSQKGV